MMPAKSKKQRRLMAIAEHHPEMVYERNKGVLAMKKKQLKDFSETKEKQLSLKKQHRKESSNEYIKRRNRQIYGK
jgi:hypothetical protein